MTELTKSIVRLTRATRHEKSKRRKIILSMEPQASVGVRLQGTRQTFRIDAEVLYEIAVKRFEVEVEKRAKQIFKTGVRIKTARAKARKELGIGLKYESGVKK